MKHAAARFTGVMVVVLTCLVGLQVAGLVSQHESERAADVRLALAADVDAIRLHDQVLTSSALLAATTGSPSWKSRYDATVPLLDEAIAHALSQTEDPGVVRALATTDEANDVLVALETEAFDRVGVGDAAGATDVLQGREYATSKRRYAAGMNTLSALLLRESRLESERVAGRARWTLSAALVAGAALVALWLVMARTLSRSQRARGEVESRLRALAETDPLTGLANRRLLARRLGTAVGGQGTSALLFIDLDGFKAVNDGLGHGVGDAVLVETARRLRVVGARHGAAMVARLGGDEFAVLLVDCDEQAAVACASSVAAALEAPHEPPVERPVGASVGVATAPAGGDPEQLLQRADAEMYAVKRSRSPSRPPRPTAVASR